ncbi:MAG: hypothetical protein ABIW76_21770 [Fibrobacteria bacterium]
MISFPGKPPVLPDVVGWHTDCDIDLHRIGAIIGGYPAGSHPHPIGDGMKDSTGSKIVFSLAFLLLFLSLCTVLAQVGAVPGTSLEHTADVAPGLSRLAALIPHIR